jgi:hypothetical protein
VRSGARELGCVAKFAAGREWPQREVDQAATSNSAATKAAWACMSHLSILRLFFTIAIIS